MMHLPMERLLVRGENKTHWLIIPVWAYPIKLSLSSAGTRHHLDRRRALGEALSVAVLAVGQRVDAHERGYAG
ncbi:MAG: hypothetical protein AABY89_02970, partial [Acidobacteriota bacterium]